MKINRTIIILMPDSECLMSVDYSTHEFKENFIISADKLPPEVAAWLIAASGKWGNKP